MPKLLFQRTRIRVSAMVAIPTFALLGPAGSAVASAECARPMVYGCGITWGKWLGLTPEPAKAFDRLSLDRIRAMGGTNVPANLAWIDIEPHPGEFHWDYVDHQVAEARRRGLEIFAYTGLTPDWALPANAPKKPGIGYRFPPDERFIPQFEEFFTRLARRYRGRVRYYEFWNEPNGCSWINDNCANGHMAASYVPWLQRWYRAMKQGDPDCVLAIGGLDYHQGVKNGWRYIEDVYKAGGGPFFDAVAIHPYGSPLHWEAIDDAYAVLLRHGNGDRCLWLNEYGWNTSDERRKSECLKTVLTALAGPRYAMVFQASYLVLTDLPGTDDRTGHDYGLCARDRRRGTITARPSYTQFRRIAHAAAGAGQEQTPRPVSPFRTGSPPARSPVPPGFMLWFAAPGCDPGGNGDDMGPPTAVRRKWMDRAGVNTATFTISWADTEPKPPINGRHKFDFSRVRPSRWVRKHPYIIAKLHFFDNPWAGVFRFKDIPRYNRRLAEWAEAACRFARERYGVTLFQTGGNERDLVAPETYRPHFPDWHFFYMDPVKAVHRGMKKAGADNRLIIGNLCYSDREHISALYDAGAKGYFEVLAIHAYGPRGVYVDMDQIIESHQEVAARGDPDIPILVTEGWSCFPLPDSIDKDQAFRRGPRPYTSREVEHYRQTVLDGWRNLTTLRPGQYDPSWLLGARYFVLNDHWGGRHWQDRAKPKFDEKGRLIGFNLDGYWIATRDPNWVKPFLRPWGLIDIEGRPKGDVVERFPPYIPLHSLRARLEAKLSEVPYHPRRKDWTAPEATAGQPYTVSVEFLNLEQTPMTGLLFSVGEKTAADWPGGYAFAFVNGQLQRPVPPANAHKIRAERLGPPPPDMVGPGQKVRLTYRIVFSPDLAGHTDRGWRKRVRPYVDLWYVWRGRPYHTDAWLPRVVVRAPKTQNPGRSTDKRGP
ncbi:MAG: hypothetical protein GXP31_08395 [Kiritimatiellaeota bacterium]|nr:hypothetical protein [Kiritimatiellota bacterium]